MNRTESSQGSTLKRRWQSRRNRKREAMLRLTFVLFMTVGTLALLWGGFYLSGEIIPTPSSQQ